jgi:hypothetical protein
VFCTDIDGDGYMDVVTADKSKNATTLYYNNLVVATHTLPSGNNNSGAHPSSPLTTRWRMRASDSHSSPLCVFSLC